MAEGFEGGIDPWQENMLRDIANTEKRQAVESLESEQLMQKTEVIKLELGLRVTLDQLGLKSASAENKGNENIPEKSEVEAKLLEQVSMLLRLNSFGYESKLLPEAIEAVRTLPEEDREALNVLLINEIEKLDEERETASESQDRGRIDKALAEIDNHNIKRLLLLSDEEAIAIITAQIPDQIELFGEVDPGTILEESFGVTLDSSALTEKVRTFLEGGELKKVADEINELLAKEEQLPQVIEYTEKADYPKGTKERLIEKLQGELEEVRTRLRLLTRGEKDEK